ncbi:MAG TPA: hypothetical protein VN837_22605 [Chloroflexota bacterium]|nr:hypothetical protein [Chloroflexota bacterium]
MKARASDTSVEAERFQIGLLRQAPIWRKLQQVEGLNQALHDLARGAILRTDSSITEEEMRRRLAERRLGMALTASVNGIAVQYTESAGEDCVEMTTIEVALLVIEQLERLKVPYVVGGSMASSAYGFFRATNDADLLADLKERHAAPLADALSSSFYVDAEAIRDAIRHHQSFNVIHLTAMLKVDVFIPRDRAFDRGQLARGLNQIVASNPERRAMVASPEDTVLAKLEWYRLGGEVSDRQWGDIVGVLKVQHSAVDLAYLRQWARVLGVADLLERALEEADLSDMA